MLAARVCRTPTVCHRIRIQLFRRCQKTRLRTYSAQKPEEAPPGRSVPGFQDGIRWYCYTALGLLFIADFVVPSLGDLGPMTSGLNGAVNLAACQWLVFVLPSLWHVRQRGWDAVATLQLQPCSPLQLAAGVGGGVALWLGIHVALALKSGEAWWAFQAIDFAASPLASSFGEAGSAPEKAVLLLVTAALSPAVAEEILFRGLLLTALSERLGRVDAVALAGALFALVHLEPGQFFQLAMLGFAAGSAATAAASVWPAVALHAAYNATGLAIGLAAACNR